MIKLLSILALAFSLHAQDTRPWCAGGAPPPDQPNCRPASDIIKPTSLATVEELTKQVAAKDQQIAQLQQDIRNRNRELALHQQGFLECREQLEPLQAQIQRQQQMQRRPAADSPKSGDKNSDSK